MRIIVLASVVMGLSACATTPAEETAEPPMAGPAGKCDVTDLQGYVGQKATAEVGAAILSASGAAKLRWGPPRTAWTMDYRIERVNVRYDDDMVIEAVTCG